MEIVARTRMIRISPRKVRIVGDVIKKKNINDAMGMLMYMPQKAAFILKNFSTVPLQMQSRRNMLMWITFS
jgi:ribosomal protein L22